MPVHHLRAILADLFEVLNKLGMRKARDGGLLKAAVARYRVRLQMLVPPFQILTPQFLFEHTRAGVNTAADFRVQPGHHLEHKLWRRAFGAFGSAYRTELAVDKIVDQTHFQRSQKQAVSPGAFTKTLGEGAWKN